jgi:hypothetical protein
LRGVGALPVTPVTPVYDDGRTTELLEASRKGLFRGALQAEALDMSSPTKYSSPPKSSGMEYDVVPDLGEHDILPPVIDAPAQLELPTPAQQQEVVHQICFLPGSVANVDWLVWRNNMVLDEKSIRNYYFLGTETTPWCLRVAVSIPIGEIWDYMKTRIIHRMSNPVLTYQGNSVNLQNDMYYYIPNSTFIIHDGAVPASLQQHGGKLWECQVCNLKYIAKKGFKKPCQRGHPHKFLFYAGPKHLLSIPDSWGRMKGDPRKSEKPWACPVGYSGHAPEVQDQIIPPESSEEHQESFQSANSRYRL